ncbi:MAG: N-acetyltransferase [Corynebacteriales bacterium]|nr:N-acetyltransferase [Mycobacteriales bacterium]
MDSRVFNHADQQRYEITVNDEMLGELQYRDSEHTIELFHTQVDARMRGQGLAEKLAIFALGEARAQGKTVYPTCPFVLRYLAAHPEYQDLIVQRD